MTLYLMGSSVTPVVVGSITAFVVTRVGGRFYMNIYFVVIKFGSGCKSSITIIALVFLFFIFHVYVIVMASQISFVFK